MMKNYDPSELTPKGQRTRQRILDAAIELFAEQGYTDTTMRDIADRARCSLGLAYRYFAQKDDLAVALYDQLAAETTANDIPMGMMADRFHHVLQTKLAQIQPHRAAFAALFGAAMRPDVTLAIHSADHHDPMVDVFRHVVYDANDKLKEPVAQSMAGLLYTFYMLVILFWLYDRTPQQRATQQLIDFMREGAKTVRPLMLVPVASQTVMKLATIVTQVFGTPSLTIVEPESAAGGAANHEANGAITNQPTGTNLR